MHCICINEAEMKHQGGVFASLWKANKNEDGWKGGLVKEK